MRMLLQAATAAAMLGALPSPAAAQDQQVGARTKAMGGSYTAFEDDPVGPGFFHPGRKPYFHPLFF